MGEQTRIDETFTAFVAGMYERGPAIRDLAAALNLGTTASMNRLSRLVEAGLIERVDRGNWAGYYRLTERGRMRAEDEKAARHNRYVIERARELQAVANYR